ncbi:VirD4-like conjugal transfer protein, CD1115 family [Vagococcus fluvialis]|uniref:VirD4-like conjugal transfer protein, CD1115 family n=1 Tax=Vagococcus fluvialis TaxID=2738 RepID=UPI003D1240F8
MNKQYKQWKKILADKRLLTVQGIMMFFVGSIVLTIIMNLLINLISQISLYFKTFKETGQVDSTHFQVNKIINGLLGSPFEWKKEILYVWLALIFYLLIMVIKRIYKQRIAFRDINTYSQGDQRLTTKKEIKEQYRAVPMDDKEYEGKCGMPVAVIDNKIYIDDANTNSSDIGGTQSGKTQLKTYPMLDLHMRAKDKDSGVVIDVKGDMLRLTKAEFERYGFDVKCLNLIEPDNGIGYNPFREVQLAFTENRIDDAARLTHSFAYDLYHSLEAKEPVWENTAMATFNGCILALGELFIRHNRIHLLTMYTFINMLVQLSKVDEDGNLALDEFFGSLPDDSIAKMQYLPASIAEGATKSSILMNATSQLTKFALPEIARLTSGEGFDFRDMVNKNKKPIIVFISLPDWDMSNSLIVTSFLTQMNQVLAREATLFSNNNKLGRRVIRYLEELGNIPPLEGLSREMNVGLERGIITRIILQAESQLSDNYGKEKAKAILNACGNQTLILSDDEDDNTKFEKKIGHTTEIVTTRHGSPDSLDKSYGEQENKRSLLNENQLNNLKEGEVILTRSKKRKDLKGKDIVGYPIFANKKDGTALVHAYKYLNHRFKSDKKLYELDLGDGHAEIDLKKFTFSFKTDIVSDLDEIEEIEEDDDNNVVEEIYEEEEQVNIMSELVESITYQKTLLKDVLSSDGYEYAIKMVTQFCSDEELRHFRSFIYVEQVTHFLNVPERNVLKAKIGHLFERSDGND